MRRISARRWPFAVLLICGFGTPRQRATRNLGADVFAVVRSACLVEVRRLAQDWPWALGLDSTMAPDNTACPNQSWDLEAMISTKGVSRCPGTFREAY
jgi:hypothetical protein